MAVNVQYQWLYYDSGNSSWVIIYGEASQSYTPSAADGLASGTQLEVSIYGTETGYLDGGYTSSPVTLQ